MNKQLQLNSEQLAAIQHYKGCCNVIAAAGSGKTTVIVSRVERLIREHGVPPEKILVLTFCRKARDELCNRLMMRIPGCAMDVNVTTFHSLGNQILSGYCDLEYRILSDDQEQIKIINSILSDGLKGKDGSNHTAPYYLQYIAAAKNRLSITNDGTIEGTVYSIYEQYKKQAGLLDYDDLIIMALGILINDKSACEDWQNKYEFVLVDEMQDISYIQYELLRTICEGHQNLFVVGDPLQNIYQWRGSDNQFMLDFKKDWPEADIIHLSTNYRSTWNIVDAANRFAECIPESKSECYVESVADRLPFQDAEYSCYASPADEAKAVKARVAELITDGHSYRDIAVLARTNKYLQKFKTELSKSNMPYSLSDELPDFIKPETVLVLCYMRLVADQSDDEAFEYVYCRPKRHLGKIFLKRAKAIAVEKHLPLYEVMDEIAETHAEFPPNVKKFRAVIDECKSKKYENMKALIDDLRELLPIDEFVSRGKGRGKDAIDNLNKLADIASTYTDIDQFLDDMWWKSDSRKTGRDAVQLLTIHKAKGLEFPIVFVVGLNRGLFPSDRSDEINEERRLMYVAMTRAKDLLYISSSDGAADTKTDLELVQSLWDRMMPTVEEKDTVVESTNAEYVKHTAVQKRKDFVWFSYDAAKILMPELKASTLTRLLILATYMNYDNVLVHDDGTRITIDNIGSLLCVSSATVYAFINELKSAGIITLDYWIKLNPTMFWRGPQNRIEQSMLYQDGKMITKIYRNGVRALYKPELVKKLSYIFRIMPFVNHTYNIVCHNPLEKDLEKILPMSLGEVTEIVGYGHERSHTSKFQSLLLDHVFEIDATTMHAIHYEFVDRIDPLYKCLIVNPEVYYGGNKHNDVSLLGRFR